MIKVSSQLSRIGLSMLSSIIALVAYATVSGKYIIIAVLLLALIIAIMKPKLYAIPFNYIVKYTEDKRVIYTRDEMIEIFPLSSDLENEWSFIAHEAKSATYNGNLWQTFETSNTSFWKGWDTYPLRVFGRDHINMRGCPVIKSLLDGHTEVVTAFFSRMHPGKVITPHYGPYEGYLRYHLGLRIPKGNDVSITVDGHRYAWKEGESVMFNECFEHSAINDSDSERIILFLDVKRKFNSKVLNMINECVTKAAMYSPHTTIALMK